MFDDYDEMLEGFYNLYVGEINRAFGHFYTFYTIVPLPRRSANQPNPTSNRSIQQAQAC